MKKVKEESIFLGNGSDEAIDLLIRAFCEPGKDNIVSIDPTYGMYEVAAAINGVEYRKAPLNSEFRLDSGEIRKRSDMNTKMIFLCSPNNPTGNSFGFNDIQELLSWHSGLIVIDEAYIDFSDKSGFLSEIENIPELVILQTLSKGWGRAGIRLGMAFACDEIINVMNKIKPPYNINTLTINEAVNTLENKEEKERRVNTIISNRKFLEEKLVQFPTVSKIYPSDANFLLVHVENADELYDWLSQKSIIVRNRSTATGCENCLRITVGTMNENEQLLGALHEYQAGS